MPPLFRIARMIVSTQISLLLGPLVLHQIRDTELSASSYMMVLGALALVGLGRKVAWGRGLCSAFVLYETLMTMAFLLPDQDLPAEDFQLGKWLSQELPVSIHIGLLVALACLQLAPLVMLSWNRDWFRKALW